MPPRKKRFRTQKSPPLDEITDLDQTQNPSWALLPAQVLVTILSLVDHDDIFHSQLTCKSWNQAAAAESEHLYRRHCLLRGWTSESEPLQGIDWKSRYKERYSRRCYECFKECTRKTLSFGPLVVRLCRSCSERNAERPGQRLIAKTQAKQRWCVSDANLQTHPYCIDANPVNPSFQPMHLYRIADVRDEAIKHYGSLEGVEKERRRRLTRR